MKSYSAHSSSSSLVLTLALSCLAACHSQSSSNATPTADSGSVDAATTTDAVAIDAPTETNTNAMGTDPSIVDDGSPFSLAHAELSKEQFLENNWSELQRMVVRINADLASQYTSPRAFTTADLVLVLYSEMAIRNGDVDIDATHSEGERGLLPLPENISYWIGAGAPPWNAVHSVEDNVYAFASYLGQVKNKNIGSSGGRTLYKDLFLFPGIAGTFVPEANAVAAVIHGYFYSGAYIGGAQVPYDAILQGLADGDSLPEIMEGTGYKNATPSRIYILEGRQQNLEAATVIWRDLSGLE